MAIREYLPQPVDCGDAGWRRMHRFTCSRCGATHDVAPTGTRAPMPAQFLEKKLRSAGWQVGKSSDHDICPDCMMKARKDKRERQNMSKHYDALAKSAAIKAEPPAQPSREDRRIIIAELESVYVDEKTGYSALWSDQKVAEKLGVPRKWVSDVREDLFGPEGSSEGAKELLSEAKAMRDAADEALKKAREFHAEIQAEAKRIADRDAAFQRRWAEMQRTMS